MKELAAALAKAQKAFPPIHRSKTVTVRTRTGGNYTFAYAPLEAIMGAIKGPLADNDIALLQNIVQGHVCTILMHASGDQFQSSGTPIKVMEGCNAQEYGSGLTYARRYDLSLTLGLCPDDDDDGNAASGNEATVERKGMPANPITPTTGCWDSIAPARQEALRRIGNGVIDFFSNGDPQGAFKYLSEQQIDNDEKVAVWSLLDSKMRRQLKKMKEESLIAEQA